MKEGIHPKYHEVEVRCACGNTFKTHSTNTEGRVERFTKRFGAQTSESRKTAAKAAKETAKGKKSARA